MKKVFVDTNIFIDLLADRRPFSKFAVEIFSKGENGKIKLHTSTHIIATVHYLMKKYVAEKELRDNLMALLEFVDLVSVDSEIIKKGLRSKHKDFEDAIQILCANKIQSVDCIVTRNIGDFKEAGIEVLAPDELVKKLN